MKYNWLIIWHILYIFRGIQKVFQCVEMSMRMCDAVILQQSMAPLGQLLYTFGCSGLRFQGRPIGPQPAG